MSTNTNMRAGTLYLVHVLTHSTRTQLYAVLADLGISAFHFTVLSVISRNDGLSARLSRRFHVTPQESVKLTSMDLKAGVVGVHPADVAKGLLWRASGG